MKNSGNIIVLDHGSGGQLSDLLIKNNILAAIGNPILNRLGDGAVFDVKDAKLAFTTDSFVVDPIFFPGGSIGDLSVNGTVNDLSMCGATPLFLSCALIIEEGFSVKDLDLIMNDMAKAAEKAGVSIVTGDTKVVSKGAADKIFITTSGVGIIEGTPFDIESVKPGDKIIVSGSIADHGTAILASRENLDIPGSMISDCAPLNHLVRVMMEKGSKIKLLRDPTRGGLATILNEIANNSGFSIRINESSVLVKKEVSAFCGILGIDPLYVANEGKLVAVVAEKDAEALVSLMRTHELGKDASVIGEVLPQRNSNVIMKTRIGGERIIPMLTGEQLPRIC